MRSIAWRVRALLLVCPLLVMSACADQPTAPDRVLDDQGDAASIAAVPDSLRSVTAGFNHSCALDVDGAAYCWGMNTGGLTLGHATTTLCEGDVDCSWRPVAVRGGHTFTHLSAGADFTCGIEQGTRTIWCWGSGAIGSSSGTSGVPVRARAQGQEFTQIDAGGFHACALAATGLVWCWGINSQGSLGAPDSVFYAFAPRRVAGSRTYTHVTAGYSHTCAIGTNTAVYCWGSNGSAQIGQPTSGPDAVAYSSVPMRVGSATGYTWVSGGFSNTCAVREPSGYVYCWGDNSSGQNGNTLPSGPDARRIQGSRSFSTVESAANHACGLETGGRITCWGTSFWGLLGNGDSITINGMSRVAGTRTYTTLSEGGVFHTCAAAGDGAVYCWGVNYFGQVGRKPEDSSTCSGTPCAIRPSRVTGTTEFAAAAPE